MFCSLNIKKHHCGKGYYFYIVCGERHKNEGQNQKSVDTGPLRLHSQTYRGTGPLTGRTGNTAAMA